MSKTHNKSIEEMHEEYNRMWNDGDFKWNGRDNPKGHINLERVWITFIEPNLKQYGEQCRKEERERITSDFHKAMKTLVFNMAEATRFVQTGSGKNKYAGVFKILDPLIQQHFNEFGEEMKQSLTKQDI